MSLSILVHTFNKYQHLWPGLIDSFRKHWPVHEDNLYLGTDLPTDYGLVTPFNVLFSGEGEWSDRLTKLLVSIPTDYLLYAQEDHWLTKSPPNLEELHLFMLKNGVLRLQISPINHYYTLEKGEGIRFFAPNSKYLVSHQPSIWRKDFLLSCLKSGESPWVNEYEGTKRLNKLNLTRKIAIFNYDWFEHKCVKGVVQ